MDKIYAHFNKAAKAWVAAIIPIVTALLVEAFTDGTRIDPDEWFAVVGLASAQWFGVYFKTNYQTAEATEEV
jgi:hypothetical protein